MIEVRVEDDRQPILAGEPLTLAQHLCRDAVGLGIPEPRADVQGVVVVVDPNLGALRWRRVLDGIELVQVDDERGVRPSRLVEHAVDLRHSGEPHDRQCLAGTGVLDDGLRL